MVDLPGGWYSGLGLALLAFGVTRLLVAATLEPGAVSFAVAGVVPLAAGLGLTLFGVALAVGEVSPAYVRSVWQWSVVGASASLVVLATTAAHSILTGRGLVPLVASGPLVGNTLLGGTIAGAVVGDRVARRRRSEDDLARYAERATLVNRLLRHEATNAATVLEGYAASLRRSKRHEIDDESGAGDEAGARTDGEEVEADRDAIGADGEEVDTDDDAAGTDGAAAQIDGDTARTDRDAAGADGEAAMTVDDAPSPSAVREAAPTLAPDDAETIDAIDDAADRIERTVDRIGAFATSDPDRRGVDLQATVERVAHEPPAERRLDVASTLPAGTLIRADDRLELLVRELVESVADHADPGSTIDLSMAAGDRGVELTVRGDGVALPEATRDLLESPGLPEFDDPRLGYGLQMVRLLVDHYGGDVTVVRTDGAEAYAAARNADSDGATERADDGAASADAAAESDGVAVDGDDDTTDERPLATDAIVVTFQRASADQSVGMERGVPLDTLSSACVAGVGAALVSGVVLEVLAGGLTTIGALYGASGFVVGTIAHTFHSVLFALLFAVALEHRRLERFAADRSWRTALGIGWGLVLWVGAAVLLLPLGLFAANVEVESSGLSLAWLLAHVLWGAILGRWYASTPKIGELRGRFRDHVD